jgi:hypothetical protein
MCGVDHDHWRAQLEQGRKTQVCTDVPLAGNSNHDPGKVQPMSKLYKKRERQSKVA